MATPLEQEYKVVIAVKDVTSEKSLKNDLECRITIADQHLLNKIPLKEAITLDIKDLQKFGFCDIQFEHKTRTLGKIRILIPNQIESKNEIEIEEAFSIKAETDDKKSFEIKGKYLIVILNKKFFPKKKAAEIPKPLTQTEYLPEKKTLSSDKKSPKANKLYASASPSTLKSQPKKDKKDEQPQNIKSEETVMYQTLTQSEKLDTNDASKAETVKHQDIPTKTEEKLRNETSMKSDIINKSETIKSELVKSDRQKREVTETIKSETKKSEELVKSDKQKKEITETMKTETKKTEELEYAYSPKPVQKVASATLKRNTPGSATKSKKAKKNEELLENLVDRALENQGVETKYAEDMAKIEECVYLTKLKNSGEERKEKDNGGADSDNGDSAKIKKILNSSYDANRDYRENFDLSPESLEKKFGRTEERTNLMNISGQDQIKNSKSKEKKRYYSPNTSFKNNNIAVDNTEASAILLENEVWRYVKNYENQIQYLKLMVYALDKKLSDYNSVRKENDLLKLELRKNEESRRELQGTIKETTDEMKSEINQIHVNYGKIIGEKNDYIDKLKSYENKVVELVDLNHKLENAKKKLEDESQENLIKVRGYNDLKAQLEISKNQIINGEKKQAEIQNNFANKLKEITQYVQSLEKQNKDLFHEKNDLKQEINDLKNSLNTSNNIIAEKNSEIDSLKRKLQINQGYELLLKNLNDQVASLTKQLEEKKLELDGSVHILDNLRNELSMSQKAVNAREKKLSDQNQYLEKQALHQDMKINHLNDLITNLTNKSSETKTSLTSLEQLVCIKEDVRKQLDFANEKNDNLTRDKESLLNKITELSDQIVHQDSKIYDTNGIINQLKDFLSQKETYCNNLKKLILEMREKGGYVPFKDDPIDNKLADYINSMNFTDSNLKILFIREGEGVYQFGTKRVYVTIHQDRINIRVGGGFMKIEDFVEAYTPLELEKLKRKDPVKIFNTNLAVNKNLAGRQVHEFEKMHTVELKPEKFNNVFRMVKKNE